LARHKFCMLSMYTYVIFSKKSYFHYSVPLTEHTISTWWVIVAECEDFKKSLDPILKQALSCTYYTNIIFKNCSHFI